MGKKRRNKGATGIVQDAVQDAIKEINARKSGVEESTKKVNAKKSTETLRSQKAAKKAEENLTSGEKEVQNERSNEEIQKDLDKYFRNPEANSANSNKKNAKTKASDLIDKIPELLTNPSEVNLKKFDLILEALNVKSLLAKKDEDDKNLKNKLKNLFEVNSAVIDLNISPFYKSIFRHYPNNPLHIDILDRIAHDFIKKNEHEGVDLLIDYVVKSKIMGIDKLRNSLLAISVSECDKYIERNNLTNGLLGPDTPMRFIVKFLLEGANPNDTNLTNDKIYLIIPNLQQRIQKDNITSLDMFFERSVIELATKGSHPIFLLKHSEPWKKTESDISIPKILESFKIKKGIEEKDFAQEELNKFINNPLFDISNHKLTETCLSKEEKVINSDIAVTRTTNKFFDEGELIMGSKSRDQVPDEKAEKILSVLLKRAIAKNDLKKVKEVITLHYVNCKNKSGDLDIYKFKKLFLTQDANSSLMSLAIENYQSSLEIVNFIYDFGKKLSLYPYNAVSFKHLIGLEKSEKLPSSETQVDIITNILDRILESDLNIKEVNGDLNENIKKYQKLAKKLTEIFSHLNVPNNEKVENLIQHIFETKEFQEQRKPEKLNSSIYSRLFLLLDTGFVTPDLVKNYIDKNKGLLEIREVQGIILYCDSLIKLEFSKKEHEARSLKTSNSQQNEEKSSDLDTDNAQVNEEIIKDTSLSLSRSITFCDYEKINQSMFFTLEICKKMNKDNLQNLVQEIEKSLLNLNPYFDNLRVNLTIDCVIDNLQKIFKNNPILGDFKDYKKGILSSLIKNSSFTSNSIIFITEKLAVSPFADLENNQKRSSIFHKSIDQKINFQDTKRNIELLTYLLGRPEFEKQELPQDDLDRILEIAPSDEQKMRLNALTKSLPDQKTLEKEIQGWTEAFSKQEQAFKYQMELTKASIEKLKKKNLALESRKTLDNSKIEELQTKIDSLNVEVRDSMGLKDENEQLKNDKDEILSKLLKRDDEIKNLKLALKETQSSLEESKDSSSDAIDGLKKENQALQSKYNTLKKDAPKLKAALEGAQKELDKKAEDQIKNENKAKKTEESLKKNNEKLPSQVRELTKQDPGLNVQSNKDLEKKNQALTEELTKLQGQFNEMKSDLGKKIEGLKTELKSKKRSEKKAEKIVNTKNKSKEGSTQTKNLDLVNTETQTKNLDLVNTETQTEDTNLVSGKVQTTQEDLAKNQSPKSGSKDLTQIMEVLVALTSGQSDILGKIDSDTRKATEIEEQKYKISRLESQLRDSNADKECLVGQLTNSAANNASLANQVTRLSEDLDTATQNLIFYQNALDQMQYQSAPQYPQQVQQYVPQPQQILQPHPQQQIQQQNLGEIHQQTPQPQQQQPQTERRPNSVISPKETTKTAGDGPRTKY